MVNAHFQAGLEEDPLRVQCGTPEVVGGPETTGVRVGKTRDLRRFPIWRSND